MASNFPTLLPTQPLPPLPPINLGDKTALLKRSTDALMLAREMVIDSPTMAEQMQAECALWGSQHDVTEETRKAYTKPFDDAKKTLMDWFRPVTDNFAEAREIARKKLADWSRQEQERVRREEQARAEAAARERARLEAEAREKQRLADEEARKAQAAREAAARAKDQAERQRLEAEAAQRELASAQHREAAVNDAMVAQVITAPAVEPVAKIRGVGTRATVEVTVTNKAAALQWFAQHPEFAHVVEFDPTKLKAMEKALGDQFKVPGIQVSRDITVASRKAANA